MNTTQFAAALRGGLAAIALAAGGGAYAQVDVPASLETLAGVRPPDPSGTEAGQSVQLSDYVTDRASLLKLGRALFWDMQVGSDGKTACASCHFNAGANQRLKNTSAPGANGVFDKPANSAHWGPNHQLVNADFPLHVLTDPLDRDSAIISTTDDVIGGQGVFHRLFGAKKAKSRFDKCASVDDPLFNVGGVNVRLATGRKTPTAINAALNHRNFWDGRANNVFNGFSPFGDRDPDAGIFVTADPSGVPYASPAKVRLSLRDASAASQAVGPPLSGVEMSCGGRVYADIARRVLGKRVLNSQQVSKTDSVFPGWSRPASRPTYKALIMKTFDPRLWNATVDVNLDPNNLSSPRFHQIEANFALFFGLAVQEYEATLISDQAPLDLHLQGIAPLGAQELAGLDIFTGKGKCVNCHGGPELSNAATRARRNLNGLVERMAMGDGGVAIYDDGFYNIGVRPTAEDLGVGGTDPWGNPLSFTRQYRNILLGGNAPDSFNVDVCSFEVPFTNPCDPNTPPTPDFRDAVDGAFKTPSLRNIALLGPYFHNGSRATLEQVVEFYNRGGDRRGPHGNDTTGFGPNGSNLDPDIETLGLTAQEQADLVAFLRNALTDPRVAWERAPFDHPSLRVRDGHVGDEYWVAPSSTGTPAQGIDLVRNLQAVGKNGRGVSQGPLQPFDAFLNAPPAVNSDPAPTPSL